MNDSLLGDRALVDKACSGDESAFADLINQHRSLVFGIIWAVLQNADDTEDATQETFILAYRNLNQLDDVGKFSSWLCTIARNVALKWVRKRTLEARGLSRVQEYQQLEFVHPVAEIDPGRWIGRLATSKGIYRSIFASGLDAHGRWHRG